MPSPIAHVPGASGAPDQSLLDRLAALEGAKSFSESFSGRFTMYDSGVWTGPDPFYGPWLHYYTKSFGSSTLPIVLASQSSCPVPAGWQISSADLTCRPEKTSSYTVNFAVALLRRSVNEASALVIDSVEIIATGATSGLTRNERRAIELLAVDHAPAGDHDGVILVARPTPPPAVGEYIYIDYRIQ